MDYEKKYKEALERAEALIAGETNTSDALFYLSDIKSIFPELAESEDERIRKVLVGFFKSYKEQGTCGAETFDGIPTDNVLAWLEKQVGCELDCPQNHQDSSHPNGCIVLEDFNGGEGFYKVHLDYLNKKQVEEVEEMIRAWNTELKTPNENIKACIGMALTDVPETRFKSYGVSLKECLAWLEKQKDYVSPQMIADAYLRGCNDTEKKWLEKQCEQDDYDDNIITRDDEILQAISVGLTDVAKDAGWSDFGGIPIEDIMAWLEKQTPNPKWTKEDEGMIKSIIVDVEYARSCHEYDMDAHYNKELAWLKSLKQRLI